MYCTFGSYIQSLLNKTVKFAIPTDQPGTVIDHVQRSHPLENYIHVHPDFRTNVPR